MKYQNAYSQQVNFNKKNMRGSIKKKLFQN